MGAPAASKAPQDEVARALAAARKLPPTNPGPARKAASWVYTNVLSKVLPKKKTVVRAFIFAVLGTLPMLMLLLLMLIVLDAQWHFSARGSHSSLPPDAAARMMQSNKLH